MVKSSRSAMAAAILALVLAACGDPVGDSPTTTTAPPATTTTTAASATTEPSATTTLPGAVIEHPNLPSARPGVETPWHQVGEGWFLALYDASPSVGAGADHSLGPVVLYLVDTHGQRYEVASWPPDDRPWGLIDAAGGSAVVVGQGDNLDSSRWWHIDLGTGATTLVHEQTYPLHHWQQTLGLSRPGGGSLLVHTLGAANTEQLERRLGGDTLILFTQPYRGVDDAFTWMPLPDGSVVVTAHEATVLVTLDGTTRDLSTPTDTTCHPARLWDEATLLAACYGLTSEAAPMTDYGDPHSHFGRLWLIPLNGAPGTPLTALPDEPVTVVDFGHSDAMRDGDRVYLQWTGDCGAAAIELLDSDGVGNLVAITTSPDAFTAGIALLDVVGERLVLHGWGSCDGSEGFLITSDRDGGSLQDLVPRVGDGRGVIGVLSLDR